jgi:ATP synthase protein I
MVPSSQIVLYCSGDFRAGWAYMADQKPSEPDHPKNQPADLQELGKNLRRARGDPDPETPGPGRINSRETNLAFRVAVELAAAMFVGGMIGWFLDKWLGTTPWFLMLFLILGMASGTLTAFHAAKSVDGQDEQ